MAQLCPNVKYSGFIMGNMGYFRKVAWPSSIFFSGLQIISLAVKNWTPKIMKSLLLFFPTLNEHEIKLTIVKKYSKFLIPKLVLISDAQ